jgi:hypothetical protein
MWRLLVFKYALRVLASLCVLRRKSWLLNHMTYLELGKKKMLAKLSKFTKWQLFSLKIALGCHFK